MGKVNIHVHCTCNFVYFNYRYVHFCGLFLLIIVFAMFQILNWGNLDLSKLNRNEPYYMGSGAHFDKLFHSNKFGVVCRIFECRIGIWNVDVYKCFIFNENLITDIGNLFDEQNEVKRRHSSVIIIILHQWITRICAETVGW